jgi:hypothetical protein
MMMMKKILQSGYNMYRDGGQTERQTNPHSFPRRRAADQEDRGRDGGTNCILRIKEQETRLILQEHDDDDDDEVSN